MQKIRKPVKKLTIEITDKVALAEALPEVMHTVTVQEVDRSLLRKVVNTNYLLGRVTPGVHAYYASDVVDPNQTDLVDLAEGKAPLPAGDDDTMPAPHVPLKKKSA